jgi:hypothetical protein
MNGNQDHQDRVDRLIQSVLAVDPSAQFEARIRKRIRSEAVAHRGVVRPMMLGLGLVAAIAIVLTLVNPSHQEWNGSHKEKTLFEAQSLPVQADPAPMHSYNATLQSSPEVPVPTVLLIDGDPLAFAAATNLNTGSLESPRLKEFSLEASEVPLTTEALASDHVLPQFEIHTVSLSGLNEGVAE